ncbi:MAG: type I secretion C-terminal target domain-containing protein [Verrucomicrobiae bacterium]|nr:type I secretion C-terminal target domain-containing protein [Verrucomicrobiae bacterium]
MSEGSSFQLFDGELALTFQNTEDPENTVRLTTRLEPTGNPVKEFSYAMEVPLMYLPNSRDRDEYLSVEAANSRFDFTEVTINGRAAILANDENSSLETSFAKRASQIRLDLRVNLPQEDLDRDGMPNWWEEQNGLNLAFAGDAQSDADADSLTALQEFLRGTDPNVSNVTPTLFTTNLWVTETGRGGVALTLVDTNTLPANLVYTVDSISAGFSILKQGVPITSAGTFTQADVEGGDITLLQDGTVTLQYADESTTKSATLALKVFSPSTSDGSSAQTWLDASRTGLADGAPIATWTDNSGNGNDAEQPIAGDRPVFRSAGGGAIDFAAANAHLFLDDGTLPDSTDGHTFFLTFDGLPTANPQSIVQQNAVCLQIGPDQGQLPYPGGVSYSVGQYEVTGPLQVTAATTIQSVRFSAEVGQSEILYSFGGTSALSSHAKVPVFSSLGLGRKIAATPEFNHSFEGKIRELIAFPTALADGEVRAISDYLQSKWKGAIVWNVGEETQPISIQAGAEVDIIRGGWGEDKLNAGPGNDIISGGAGDDLLTGGSGADRFSYSEVDTGRDTIVDFSAEGADHDILDLNHLFDSRSGDLSHYLSIRSEAVFRDGLPTVATIVAVDAAGDGGEADLEILLEGSAFSNDALGWLTGEGIIETGALRLPEVIDIAASETTANENTPRLWFSVTRSGNASHRQAIALTTSGNAEPGVDYILGGVSGDTERPVLEFDRGEVTKSVLVYPLRDALTENPEAITLTVLPNAGYDLGASSATISLEDGVSVSTKVVVAHAQRNGSIPAVISLRRAGQQYHALTVPIHLGGEAVNGRDYEFVSPQVTFAPGQTETLVEIVPKEDALANGAAKLVQLSILPDDSAYVTVNPWLASVLIVDTRINETLTLAEWKSQVAPANTQSVSAFANGNLDGDFLNNFEEYAFFTDPTASSTPIDFEFEIYEHDGFIHLRLGTRPDLADVDFLVEWSRDLGPWADGGDSFSSSQEPFRGGKLRRLWKSTTPASGISGNNLYRVRTVRRNIASLESDASVVLGIASQAIKTGGNAPWKPAFDASHLTAGNIENSQRSDISVQVEGPTILSFEWMASTEASADALSLLLNGNQMAQISGTVAWTSHSVNIPAGKHEVTWSYHKDASGEAGQDSVGLRNVNF